MRTRERDGICGDFYVRGRPEWCGINDIAVHRNVVEVMECVEDLLSSGGSRGLYTEYSRSPTRYMDYHASAATLA